MCWNVLKETLLLLRFPLPRHCWLVSQAAVIQHVVSATAVVATVATPWGFWSLVGPLVVLFIDCYNVIVYPLVSMAGVANPRLSSRMRLFA